MREQQRLRQEGAATIEKHSTVVSKDLKITLPSREEGKITGRSRDSRMTKAGQDSEYLSSKKSGSRDLEN
jgi:hypothetical protein